MRYLIYLTLLVWSLITLGQTSNLIFFTEEGEKFTLYVNGAKVNDIPDTQVKAVAVSGDFTQVKIVFEIPGAPELKKGIMLDPGMEMSSLIKKNKKGKYVFRPVSSSPIPADQQSETVRITQTAPPVQQQTTTVTTTTTTTQEDDGSLVDLKVTKDGGISMKVNHDTFFGDESESSSTSTTKTTSSSSSVTSGQQLSATVEGSKILLSDGRVFTFKYVNSNRIGPVVEMKQPAGAQITISYDGVEAYSSEVPFVYQENDWKKSKVYFKLSVSEPTGSWSVKLKHNSSKMVIDGAASQQVTTTPTSPQPAATSGCAGAMANGDFERAKESINNKSFADEKLTVFKQIIRGNCISVDQVVGFMDLFTFEEGKLEVAKLAYAKTVDQGNYYRVNDALTFSDSVEELEAFLAKQ